MCGRCITDQGLSATLASGVNTLPQLLTLSLRGAYRLTDSAVDNLLAAAPNLTSLELRKCSLMTDDVIRMVADALGAQLRGFSVEGSAQLDGGGLILAP
jgi:DNA repair protein RAD7